MWNHQLYEEFESDDILSLHKSIQEYSPTPLISLRNLAERLGLKSILIKDESYRFGLKAFKALGASYAIYRFVKNYFENKNNIVIKPDVFYRENNLIPPDKFTFCTATDGNHGRAVAWVAKKLKQKAVIFIPQGTVSARIDNIKTEGAKVNMVKGNYDNAVEIAAQESKKNGWQIISDTSWVGYTEITRWIMAGYITLFKEIHDASKVDLKVDAVFIQAGVGSLAATASWYYNKLQKKVSVKLISVEPTAADCLLKSIRSTGGEIESVKDNQPTIMAGLNCGTPSLIAWPFIKAGFDLFMTVSDEDCRRAMRIYYYPKNGDRQIISGESGAAGLAALLNIYEKEKMLFIREKLNLTKNSTVLILNTEGNTDPIQFNDIIN